MNKEQVIWVIDIGDYSTKITKAKRGKNIEIIDLILEPNWNKKKMNEKRDFFDRLNVFFKAYKRRDEVILLIGDADLRLDFWRLPVVDKDELEAIIYWKMQQISQAQLKNFHYDYLARKQVDNYKNLGINEYYIEALSIFIDKEIIRNYLGWFKKNGHIRLDKIQSQFLGIGKSLKKAKIKRGFFLDLGFSKTILYDFKNGMLSYKIDIIPKEKQSLSDYLKMIRRIIEDNVQLDQYKNKEKTSLFLIGGGSLICEIERNLKCSEKWKLSSLYDLLENCPELTGIREIEKEEMSLFFASITTLINDDFGGEE